MATWLVLGGHGFKPETRYNIELQPCPTILATGLGSYKYWFEEDGVPTMTTTNKPVYQIPSIAEIRKIPWNGLTVASTFSGAGGSCTGYRMAGCKVVWANEFVPAAQESYKANADPSCYLDPRDIKLIKPEEILAQTGLRRGELDIFDGSPPCQAFSTAGQREKGWGKNKKYEHGAEQQNETLFTEYIRLLRGLQPRAFIAENVSGLVKGTAKGFFLEILKELKDSGYQVECKLLDAKWLGVPQSRQRVIFMGLRNDLQCLPVFPKPLPYYYTVRDALPHLLAPYLSPLASPSRETQETITSFDKPTLPLTRVIHDTGGTSENRWAKNVDITDKPCPTITIGIGGMNSSHFKVEAPIPIAPSRLKDGAYGHRELDLDQPCPTVTCASPGNDLPVPYYGEQDIAKYAIGDEWDKLKPGQQSDKYFSLIKVDPNLPPPAVLASHGGASIAGIVHPTQKRKFTIQELKRICSFPDDFILAGSYAQQWERLGNSVPPLMMKSIAAALCPLLLSLPKGRQV